MPAPAQAGDAIEALSPEREALWTRIDRATFLTQNEKRSAVGYGPLEASDPPGLTPADDVLKNSAHHHLEPHPGGLSYKYPGQPRTALGEFDFGKDPNRPQSAQGRRFFGPRRPVPVPPGTTIRNKDLAGKKHPDTSIPFDGQGFPDFSSVTRDTATFPHTGDPDKDRATANRQKGYARTPDGWVWHHHQDGQRMQLVPKDIHARTGHTGSRGIGNLPGRR
jgi:hypothetical protein